MPEPSRDPKKKLVDALRVRGWSQGELERRLGVADGLVSKWTRGVRRPGLDYAFAIERLLGIPAALWIAKT